MNYREAKSLADYDMSLSDIRDWYERARTDRWYKTQLPITMASLAGASQLGPATIYEVMNQKVVPNPQTVQRIQQSIEKIERREIIWVRSSKIDMQCIHVQAPKSPPFRAKLTPNNGFSIFAICSSCGGNKWFPIKILGGKEHIVCYSCLPPNQWLALGAEGVNRSLIKEYIEANNHA